MRRVPDANDKPLRTIRADIPVKEWKVIAVKAVMEDRDMQDVVRDILVEYAKNYKP